MNEDNTLATKLLTVFKDITCSELKADVTNEEINKLPSKYFVHIAEALKNNAYDEWEKEFRIRKYNAYSDINEWAEKLMTKHYSSLDNLTSIAVEKKRRNYRPCWRYLWTRSFNTMCRRRKNELLGTAGICTDRRFGRRLLSGTRY